MDPAFYKAPNLLRKLSRKSSHARKDSAAMMAAAGLDLGDDDDAPFRRPSIEKAAAASANRRDGVGGKQRPPPPPGRAPSFARMDNSHYHEGRISTMLSKREMRREKEIRELRMAALHEDEDTPQPPQPPSAPQPPQPPSAPQPPQPPSAPQPPQPPSAPQPPQPLQPLQPPKPRRRTSLEELARLAAMRRNSTETTVARRSSIEKAAATIATRRSSMGKAAAASAARSRSGSGGETAPRRRSSASVQAAVQASAARRRSSAERRSSSVKMEQATTPQHSSAVASPLKPSVAAVGAFSSAWRVAASASAKRRASLEEEQPSAEVAPSFVPAAAAPVPAAATSELSAKLARRQRLNDGGQASPRAFNPYQFEGFNRAEIKKMMKMFKTYAKHDDGTKITLLDLKFMMEKLGHPQTHVALKSMIREVDADGDSALNMEEFFMIFRKSRDGSLQTEGLGFVAGALVVRASIDVAEVGVKGAKHFFEKKIDYLTRGSTFEQQIKSDQERLKKERDAAAERRAKFRQMQSRFK